MFLKILPLKKENSSSPIQWILIQLLLCGKMFSDKIKEIMHLLSNLAFHLSLLIITNSLLEIIQQPCLLLCEIRHAMDRFQTQ